MVWAKSKQLRGTETLNIFNQMIAMFPSCTVPPLTEKALLLTNMNEWEQALDTAQRVLDIDSKHLDALKVDFNI